jgi:carbamoyl-phosphate synthase large subunit
VLVTGAGSPAGIAVLKSLAGTAATVYAADADAYAAGLYMVPRDRRLVIPSLRGEELADMLLEHCRAADIEAIVPTGKDELMPLARRRARFIAAGIFPVMPIEDTIRIVWDRWALHQRLSQTVRMPRTALLDENFDPATVSLPAMVAPRHVDDERPTPLVRSRAELDTLPHDGSLVLSEILPGAVFSLDVLAGADRRVVAVVPQSQLSVQDDVAVAVRTVHDERLETLGAQAAEAVGLTSAATMRVKLSADGEPVLVGIDPRFSAATALTVASGADLPRLAVGEACGNPLPDRLVPFREVAMVRYLEERFFPYEEIALLKSAASLDVPPANRAVGAAAA